MSEQARSAERLVEMLAADDGALKAYTGDMLYHVQVDYTCQLLDVVDTVTDRETAERITDEIYGCLTGIGVTRAAQIARDWKEQAAQFMPMHPIAPPGIFDTPRGH